MSMKFLERKYSALKTFRKAVSLTLVMMLVVNLDATRSLSELAFAGNQRTLEIRKIGEGLVDVLEDPDGSGFVPLETDLEAKGWKKFSVPDDGRQIKVVSKDKTGFESWHLDQWLVSRKDGPGPTPPRTSVDPWYPPATSELGIPAWENSPSNLSIRHKYHLRDLIALARPHTQPTTLK